MVMVAFCATFAPPRAATAPQITSSQNSQTGMSAKDKQTSAAFEKRVKEYVRMRERLERQLPKLSKDATPEQIEAHKTALQERVRAARAGVKPGQIFRPDIAGLIRAIIKDEFKGKERQELRKDVLVEADTKAVPLRINYPYPETQEQLEMAPTLLLRLPPLPKQVKYRFVGRNMLLVDRENGLIVDYMLDALP